MSYSEYDDGAVVGLCTETQAALLLLTDRTRFGATSLTSVCSAWRRRIGRGPHVCAARSKPTDAMQGDTYREASAFFLCWDRCSFYRSFTKDSYGHALPSFAKLLEPRTHTEPLISTPNRFLNRRSVVRILSGAPVWVYGSGVWGKSGTVPRWLLLLCSFLGVFEVIERRREAGQIRSSTSRQ